LRSHHLALLSRCTINNISWSFCCPLCATFSNETPKNMFQNSNKVELFVHGDIFNQTKLLVNHVDLRINFNIEKQRFI